MSNCCRQISFCSIFVLFAAAWLVNQVEQAQIPTTLTETQQISPPFHVSWRDGNNTKFDLIFSLRLPLNNRNILQNANTSLLTEALGACNGRTACLISNGTSAFKYDIDNFQVGGNSTTYKSIGEPIHLAPGANSTLAGCKTSRITVNNYCSQHWNPPTHSLGYNCDHAIDWHSPYTCGTSMQNLEQKCYTYDSQGNLYDLTWFMDENDYMISEKDKVFASICNENKICGANVAICQLTDGKKIDLGLNNQTTIYYNEQSNQLSLMLLGEPQSSCSKNPESRIRTTIVFRCPSKGDDPTKERPKEFQTNSTGCNNTIVWYSSHACPSSETKKAATLCGIESESLGIKVNMSDHLSSIIRINGTDMGRKHDIAIRFCQGFSTKDVMCNGHSSNQVSACLLDRGSSLNKLNESNSEVIGTINKSSWQLSDGRLRWESEGNKKCTNSDSTLSNRSFNTGVKVDFVCNPEHDRVPLFVGYSNCDYHFEWRGQWPGLCHFHENDVLEYLAEILKSTKSDGHPNIFEDKEQKSGQEKHREAINDSKTIKHDEHSIEYTIHEKNSSPPAMPKDTAKQQVQPNMESWHKAFMIGLIFFSLTMFLTAIVVLDKKTRFRLKLRRQARHPYQRSVPYNRIDDDLDL